MAHYQAPLDDMKFLLKQVFKVETLWQDFPETSELAMDLAEAILEEGARMCESLLFPLNRSGDEEGCQFQPDGTVITPKGFREAYQTYADNGWTALGGNPEFGGQGMPKMLTVLFEEMLCSANTSFSLYPVLSNGAALALNAHASESIKQQYLPKIYEGRWSATMCLTEPHAGTDLGIIKSKAEPAEEGVYRITGTKIFITGGEHDLTENIVHLVLAKLPDAPAGSKGISLFLVPKFIPNSDGSLGERNGVSCGSIEHKMGIKGSATCVMNFDDAKGWMIGEPNQGLACMFTMMNYERLSIGLQGLALGEAAYQSAVLYARERLQSRAPGGPQCPEKNADPIIVHPDVRRMLLTQRAINEAARCFALYVARQLDIAKFSKDSAAVQKAESLVALLTPVAKAFFSDRGFENCVMAQQVFGGHGYIREWGMEQFVRDARIAQIYEGTNGIQALDLAGRKTVRSGGRLQSVLLDEIQDFLAKAQLPEFARVGVQEAVARLQRATDFLLTSAGDNPDLPGAASVDYLDLMGYTLYAYMWAMMLDAVAGEDSAMAQDKQQVARFYFAKLLPKTEALLTTVLAGSDPLMTLPADRF